MQCNLIESMNTAHVLYGKEYEQLSKQQQQYRCHHQPSIIQEVVIAAVHQEQVFVVLWNSFIWWFHFDFNSFSGENICTS